MIKKLFFRTIARALFGSRRFSDRSVRAFARGVSNKRILELGSGKKESGEYNYSAKCFFDASNSFVCSDVVPEYGHEIVDAAAMGYKDEFDIILCVNVLEHVFNFCKALDNIYAALKSGGTLVLFVPAFYPLHDEPADYWRFTEHSLRKLLSAFKDVKMTHSGIREYPFAYYLEAVK
jgi:SAM-dependent methyltransferase